MVLRHRDFRLLWLGQTVSQLGNQFNYIALAWMVLQSTGSSTRMGGVFLAQVLPNALFGWVAGLAVDRFDRRRLMMTCSLVRGLLVLTLPLAYALGHLPLALVYAVTFALSTLTLVFYAAEKTLIPELVSADILTEANAYAEMTSQIAGLAGPVLAGLLIAVLPSPVYALYLDAFGFATSTLALGLLHFRDQPRRGAAEQSVLEEVREGVLFLAHDRFLLVLCCTATAINFLVGPFAVIFPVFSARDLQAGSQGFGWLMGSLGGGMLVGSLLAQRLTRLMRDSVVIYAGMVVVGLSFAAMGLAPNLALAALGAACAGLAVTPGNAVTLTLIQRLTPAHLQGRVFSTLFAVVNVATPLGVALASPLLDAFGCRTLLLWIGGLTTAVALIGWAILPAPSTRQDPSPSPGNGEVHEPPPPRSQPG